MRERMPALVHLCLRAHVRVRGRLLPQLRLHGITTGTRTSYRTEDSCQDMSGYCLDSLVMCAHLHCYINAAFRQW